MKVEIRTPDDIFQFDTIRDAKQFIQDNMRELFDIEWAEENGYEAYDDDNSLGIWRPDGRGEGEETMFPREEHTYREWREKFGLKTFRQIDEENNRDKWVKIHEVENYAKNELNNLFDKYNLGIYVVGMDVDEYERGLNIEVSNTVPYEVLEPIKEQLYDDMKHIFPHIYVSYMGLGLGSSTSFTVDNYGDSNPEYRFVRNWLL